MKLLSREIKNHIFDCFGVGYTNREKVRKLENINTEKYSLKNKIVLELEENEKSENNVFGIEVAIDGSLLRIVYSNILDLETSTSILIIMFDNFPPFVLDSDDEINLYNDGKFYKSNLFLQAKLLMGIEQLFDLPLLWNKINKSEDMFDILIGYINYKDGGE